MKKILLLFLYLSCLVLFAQSALDSKARWIWYPEAFSDKTNNTDRFARVVFSCHPADTTRIKAYYYADDRAEIWLNGHKADETHRIGGSCQAYDLTDFLLDGTNAVCAKIHNGSGPAGLVGRIAMEENGQDVRSIFTNADWRISRTEEPGWLLPDFDDSAWAVPQDMGNTLTPPWSFVFDNQEFYAPEELAIYLKEKEEKINRMQNLIKQLEQEPELHASLEILPGTTPKIVINGVKHPAANLYNSPYKWAYDEARVIEKFKNFRESGIHLYSLGIESDCWTARGVINEQEIADRLYKALLLNPDAYLMLDININGATGWWIKENPDQIIDYANGGVDPKASNPIDNIAQPSYASRKWRKDTADYLKQVVSYVESLPVGKRVYAYRVDYGVYREWHYYGMRSGMPDISKPMQEAFRRFLAEKYGTDEALQGAWNDKAATLQTVQIPSMAARLHSIDNGYILRDPVEDAAVIDFLHCLQGEMRDLLLSCNTAVKEACGYRKLCGNYHGYIFGMEYPVEAWTLENEKLLASDVVDFQSCPNMYAYREVDGPEFGRAAFESCTLRGKLAIQEHDSRTHLALEETYHRHVDTPIQSVTTLSRDFAQSLCRNAGCWWMDFGRPWYNDPQIFAFFHKLSPILKLAEVNPPVSEVAFVTDLDSVYYYKIVTTPTDLIHDANAQELTHTGVPFDALLLSDLANPKVRDYKVYVLSNLFHITPEKAAIVEALRKAGKTIVWLYAPGYLNAQGHSVESIKALTGFSVTKSPQGYTGAAELLNGHAMIPETDLKLAPSFAITDDSATPLAYRMGDRQGGVTFASRKDGKCTQYYSTTGFLSREAWRDIFLASGVHCYETSGTCVIWATDSFVSINGNPGKYTIALPQEKSVTPLLPFQEPALEGKRKTIEVELTEEIGMKLFHLE